MGNLFSRTKQPVIVTDDEQFFDCLNDDDSHEHDEQTTLDDTKIISHYYAVCIPPTIETTGKRELFCSTSLFMSENAFRNTIHLR